MGFKKVSYWGFTRRSKTLMVDMQKGLCSNFGERKKPRSYKVHASELQLLMDPRRLDEVIKRSRA